MKSKSPKDTTASRTRRALVGVAKLGLCGATIFAIGWAFLTLAPSGEVADSQADIADFDLLAPKTNAQRFMVALDELGHEKPRIYNYNGTELYFSTRTTPKRPRELITEYQEEFVRQGVNEKVWGVRVDVDALERRGELEAEAWQRARAGLEGQILVNYHDRDRVIMSGAVVDWEKAKPRLRKGDDGEIVADVLYPEVFQAHRYIEANWNPVRQETVVTATWADEANFDITKTFPRELQRPGAQDLAPDDTVPACLGCERLTRFATAANDKPYVKQIFTSTRTVDELRDFYERAMRNRGWKPSPTTDAVARAADVAPDLLGGGELLQFSRGSSFVTISINPDPDTGETYVSTMLTD